MFAISAPTARVVLAGAPRPAKACRGAYLRMFAYKPVVKGPAGTFEYRVFVEQDGKVISPWHDVPYKNADGTYNFFCEIPKETKAKMECATDEPSNPIKQDTKKGKLRDYPYNIHWNYGMIPQTWEDPQHANAELGGVKGDNDPVDVVEIGSQALASGGIYKVKPLGVYAMIDDGELDWKVVAIRADDPLAAKVSDVEDVEREMPGELTKVMEWFRDYKIPDGKPANKYGFDNKCMNRAYALKVIDETHGFYAALKSGSRKNEEELALN